MNECPLGANRRALIYALATGLIRRLAVYTCTRGLALPTWARLGSERLRNDVQQCRDEDGGIASALTMQSLLRRETGRLASS